MFKAPKQRYKHHQPPCAPVHDPLSFIQSLITTPEYEPLEQNPSLYKFSHQYGAVLLYIHLHQRSKHEEKYIEATTESLGCFIPFDFEIPTENKEMNMPGLDLSAISTLF